MRNTDRGGTLGRVETMFGIAALIASVGLLILCAGLGIYFLTGAGRQGVEIARLEAQKRSGVTP